jgi:hypothetical protein
MTNKELYNLVQGGAQPLVRVVNAKTIDGTIWDNGMVGKIERVFIEDEGTRDEHYQFQIKERPFREVNKPYMVHNYYDKKGVACLTYVESGYEPKNGVESTFCMPNDTTFELVKSTSLISEYLTEESELPYVEWLEAKVRSLRKG